MRLSPKKERGTIVLLNAGFDVIKQATIHFRGPMGQVHVLSPGSKKLRVKPVREKHGWSLRIKDLAPWRVQALLLG